MIPAIRRDLGLQLLALYLLFVGPVVLASLVFDRLASERLEADVKAADLSIARAIAYETSTVIDLSLQAIRQIGSYPPVIQGDQEEMEALFRVVLSARPDVNLIYRLDEEGTMTYHYPHGPGSTLGWDFSHRDYFQRALQTRSPLFSEGRISPTTEQPVATAVMPLWTREGEFLGLVAINIKLQSLSHTLARIIAEHRAEEGFQVTILDSAGRVIAHPNPSALLQEMSARLPAVSRAVLSGQSGNLIATEENEEETLYSYVPIPVAGWGVIVSRPAATAFATPRSTHRWATMSVTLYLFIGVIIWIALSRQIIQPLERLAAFSQIVGREDGSNIETRKAMRALSARPDQIGHLSSSLTRMEKAIQARLAELSTLLKTSAAVVSTLDSPVVLDRILEQVERLMDISLCTLMAWDEERGVFRPKASRGLSRRYTEHLVIDPNEPLSVTLRAIRTGQPVQVSDVETDPSYAPFRPRARSEGYRSILAVPLNTQHAPPSALLVYRREPHVFSEREINLLSSFANHAAMAIENATLYANSDMRLKEQTHRLEALIQSMQDGLILHDLKGSVVYANRRLSELTELTSGEIAGAPVKKVIERIVALSLDVEKTRAEVNDLLKGQGQRRMEFTILQGGQTRYMRLQVFDVNDQRGTLVGRGQIWRDITRSRELDRMKSSLISTVSHELRTPLAAIKGYATTLLAEDVEWDRQSQREFLEIISAESDRLSELVDDLLDMSRIESGSLVVKKTHCNLKELVERAALRAHPNPQKRLVVEIPEDLPPISVDPRRLEAVLRNLIENAAKYDSSGGPIRVSACLENHKLMVRVEDTGPGIPSEHCANIFKSFYRVADGLNRPTAGAGLGLAISQGFVRAHGGDIWLEPRPVGACVAFFIPRTAENGPTLLEERIESSAQ